MVTTSVIGLLFYIVKKDTSKRQQSEPSSELIYATKTVGYAEGLQLLLEEIHLSHKLARRRIVDVMKR